MPRNQRLLNACANRPVDAVPVWYMRQAGRYQPEYRQIRETYSLLEICRHPEICCQVTKLPVEQLGVDAAILFSDIMVPLGPMGVDFDIQENVGPVVGNPIRGHRDVSELRQFDPATALPYVLETIQMLANDLDVPLIGFTGAPFTLASYLIEGRPSRNRSYIRTKQLMWGEPALWATLMDKLADMIISYLTAQVHAGASAVQVFDSWVGTLAPGDFQVSVLPAMRKIFNGLKPLGVPMIYFGVETGDLLPAMADSGASVIGVDWRVPLPMASTRVGRPVALQGNLDPAMLFAPWSVIERRLKEIVDEGLALPGFVFNLGHGIIHHDPPVNPQVLRDVTSFVHEYSRDRLQKGAR